MSWARPTECDAPEALTHKKAPRPQWSRGLSSAASTGPPAYLCRYEIGRSSSGRTSFIVHNPEL